MLSPIYSLILCHYTCHLTSNYFIVYLLYVFYVLNYSGNELKMVEGSVMRFAFCICKENGKPLGSEIFLPPAKN